MAGNSISTRSYLPSIRPFHNRVEDQEVESRPFFVDNKWQINSEANLKWVQTKNKLETENELKWHLRKNSHKYIVHTSILERWTKEEDQKAILPIPNHFLCKSVISGVALYILFGAQITAISLIADLAIQGLRKLRDKDINLSNYLQLGKKLEWFKMPSSEYFRDLKIFAIIIVISNIFWGIIFKLTKVVIDQKVIHYMKDAILNKQYLII